MRNILNSIVFMSLLVGLGKHPFVATSTGMFMSIFLSAGIVVAYSIEGFFDDAYFLFFGMIASIASLTGMFLWNRIFIIVNRSSLFYFLLTVNWLAIGGCLSHQIISRKFQDGSVRESLMDFGTYWIKNS